MINFENNNRLIPAIIQDDKSGEVYMLGYMNKQSIAKTKESGYVWFFSRSKKGLWMKGEKSGNKLKINKIITDCDKDSLLIKVTLEGRAVCHTGNLSCFFEEIR